MRCNLFVVQDGEDAGENGDLDAHRPGTVAEPIKGLVVEEKLRGDEVRPGIHLALQIQHVRIKRGGFNMPFRITGDANGKMVCPPDE